jgi:soluble lytic murein transglycosylase-like protein
LDAALVQAVCEQESGWEPWAIRFEPAFKARYVDPQNHEPTEAVARSISWGLMQIMGEVARELGYKGHLAQLCDPGVGLEWGCKHLANKLKNTDIHTGLQHWNGGGNPHYADQVIARMSKYADPSNPPR